MTDPGTPQRPDLDAMPEEEAVAWLMEHGDELMTEGHRAGPGRLVDAEGNEVMRQITVRLPVGLVVRLDAHAGRDREGRSGLIRMAVVDLLNKLDAA
ncbi:hypothetical protein [Dactylosporangium sp. CA-092794]|uniref:hypothetical protein n=1 Tax=Dactylosporangium sp. CA-092794 TaxID=3239929 RepID=UPI003D8E1057